MSGSLGIRPDGAAGVRTVFLVAAEESGDLLGAALIRALKSQSGAPLRFIGVGGRAMVAEGLERLFTIDDLSLLGLTSLPRRLPLIWRRIRAIANAAVAARPQVLVIIDCPDLTHRIARRVRDLAPFIPIVDYVAPSVWAWRPWRARAMRRYVDHVLALLPFEPAVFARLDGPPCSYVGHPLIDEIGALRPDPAESARRLAEPPILLVLPGSRVSEIERLSEPFGGAIERLRSRCGPIDLVLPTVPHLAETVRRATAGWAVQPRILTTVEQKRAAMRTARAALAKSGTVTLELALAGIPMVTAYRVSKLDELIARCTVTVPSFILPNLILGENVVPEFLQSDCTPQNLADALIPLVGDSEARRRQVAALARLDGVMEIGRAAPSARAAEIVLAVAADAVGAGASG
jgi:lipid-A-disaccharide synthase